MSEHTGNPDNTGNTSRNEHQDHTSNASHTNRPGRDEPKQRYRGSEYRISRRDFLRNLALGSTIISFTGISGAFLAACASEAPHDVTLPDSDVPLAGSGRTLRLRLEGVPSGLDTNYVFDGNSNRIVNATTPALFRLDKDGIAQPDLVDTYTKSADGLTYTFTLKDAVWTSGSPVTAHDLVYSWKRLADPANAFGNSYFFSAAGIQNAVDVLAGDKPVDDLAIRAVDDTTLEIVLERPVPYVERILVNANLRPIEQAFFEAQGANWGTSPETHNSSGPYKLSFYQPGSPSIELVKNPDYYDADKIVFDTLTYQVITDSQQLVLAYQNGEVDIAEVSGEQVTLYEDDPEFVQVLRGQTFYVALNTIINGLDSPKLRLALGLAIDKEYLTQNILDDGSTPVHGFVPWNFAFDSKGQDFREVAGTYQETNRAEALKLWEEVKAEKGIDSLTLAAVTGEGDYSQRLAQYIQSEIQNTLPGITIELTITPDDVWYEELERREWGLDIDWWWGGYPDAAADLQLLGSSSPYNFSGYANKEFDELLASADKLPLAADEKARIQTLIQAEKIILEEDTAVLPLFQVNQGFLVNPALDVEFAKGGGLYILETIRVK
jgi:oligopeptide transport system substrate-binding protein